MMGIGELPVNLSHTCIPVCETENTPFVYSHTVCKTNPALVKILCPDLENNLSQFQWKIITKPK